MWMRAGPGASILAARKPTKSPLPGSMVAGCEAMVACWMAMSEEFNQISEAGLARERRIGSMRFIVAREAPLCQPTSARKEKKPVAAAETAARRERRVRDTPR